MAYIKVNHKEFERAAEAIEDYVSRHKSNMDKIEQEIVDLSSAWQGEDYREVKSQWHEMEAKDSTSGQMIKALEDYADFLKNAGKAYKNAQANAINRANKLPKW